MSQPLSIRRFTLSSFAILAAVVGLSQNALSADAGNALSVTEVAAGVYVHFGQQEVWSKQNKGDIANLSFVVGDKCVAVIDTGSTWRIGQRLKAAIKNVTNRPVCFVINTHVHPDHILGNAAFESDAIHIAGHSNLARGVASRGPNYLNAVKRDLPETSVKTRLVGPTLIVNDSTTIDLGDRTLQVNAWPTSHTDTDLTVFDTKSETLWLGDLSFVGHIPVVDGKLNGWITTMEKLATQPAKRAVPGHGGIHDGRWADGLAKQQDYLVTLRRDVRAMIQQGKTLSDALASVRTGADDGWLLYKEFHQRNVSAAYAELEWE